MSRTFRRKDVANWIDSSSNYSRIAGYYTEWDWDREGQMPVYRMPTPEELFRRWRYLHNDGGAHYRFHGMNKFARRSEQKTDRSKSVKKISRFLKGIDDDIVNEKRGINPHWWW